MNRQKLYYGDDTGAYHFTRRETVFIHFHPFGSTVWRDSFVIDFTNPFKTFYKALIIFRTPSCWSYWHFFLFAYLFTVFIYLIFIIEVSKDTGVPYKTTNDLCVYLEEKTNWTFYFKIPLGLNKPIQFYFSRTEPTTPEYIYNEVELLKQDKRGLQVINHYQRPTRPNLFSLQVLSLQTIASANLYQQPKKIYSMALSLNIEYTPTNPPINKVKYLISTHYKFCEIYIQLSKLLASTNWTYNTVTSTIKEVL